MAACLFIYFFFFNASPCQWHSGFTSGQVIFPVSLLMTFHVQFAPRVTKATSVQPMMLNFSVMSSVYSICKVL